MKLRTLKGTKDFLPEEQIIREKIRDVLIKTFRLYGFSPAETPILEFYDILASKYAGGAEILKETYTLTDRGNRKLALRYDLTVPLSRMIGINPYLKMPFKRYEIGKVFRDGPVKTGRMREFTQCDADAVGIESMSIDAEIIAMTLDVFKKLGIDIYVKVNNRKLLSGILETVGVGKDKIDGAILSIDKLEKIGVEGVKKELREKGIEEKTFDSLFELLTISGEPEEVLNEISLKINSKIGKQGIEELRELFNYLKAFNIKENVVLSLSLARGLEIYTGTIFEVYMKEGTITSSLAAGGRYDKIIGKFLRSKKVYPAVGISFGLDAIYEVLKLRERNKQKSVVKVYIIPVKTTIKSFEIARKLREAGIETDMDQLGRSISKNLDCVNKLGIPYAMIVGEKELAQNKVLLKNMQTGEQELLSIDEAINKLKSEEVNKNKK